MRCYLLNEINMGKCNEKAQALESIDERKKALELWLTKEQGISFAACQPMPGDASSRRYFRLYTKENSFVLMDAPSLQENCRSFIAIANTLRDKGLHTPEIIRADVEKGFLLLSDFGDATYLKSLNAQTADSLYQRALQALAVMQQCRHVNGLSIPLFTREFMWQEWAWHKEWFLEKWLGLTLTTEEEALDHCYSLIVESAATQAQVFMHRDYHSANLMVLADNKIGILDFQDAFIGPVTYDLVSLLRDCYIEWPQEQVTNWVLAYLQQLHQLHLLTSVDEATFLRWFDYMSLQRHLKALLTFARKKVRDQEPRYLKYIPRTLEYLLSVSQRYTEFEVLFDYLDTKVKPAFLRTITSCAQ